ncbi:MAG: hypothetical protein KDA24_27075 [Deltaproteobacteria bacterium]|nr:hypothetical protein [Deltaproteobacteria bacterium]
MTHLPNPRLVAGLWFALLLALGGCTGSGSLTGDDDDTTTDDDDSAVDDDDDDATGDDDDSTPGIDCDAINPAPVEFETVTGILSAEDFVFSADGGVLSVDFDGNLVRSERGSEEATLVAPGVTTGSTAGISMLPNGDVVIADVGAGALVRVAANGGTTTLLSGLGYPNGIEVHRDGWVAVAEQDTGQVRRVDADTGEFVILAKGLPAPNGVTFSPDYNTLYVNSFGGGAVRSIALSPEGAAGPPQLHGSTSGGTEPPWGADPWSTACDGASMGDPCVLIDQTGTCEGIETVLWCQAPDPFQAACDGLSAGDECSLLTETGTCEGFAPGPYYCDNSAWWGGGAGALDGIAVDACNNVYVTDFGQGQVIRWTEEGGPPEVVATLPDFWIPNMDFGPGTGGWDSDKLWVISRDGGTIYGLDIGIPGRPVAHR